MTRHGDFECHLDFECFYNEQYLPFGFHSKGYLFEFDNKYELVVGSSNITRYALLKNIEWDIAISDSSPTNAYIQARSEFQFLWDKTYPLSNEIINQYANKLNYAIERWDMDYDLENREIKPNFMQRRALKELNRFRAIGQTRALVIAASGSGNYAKSEIMRSRR